MYIRWITSLFAGSLAGTLAFADGISVYPTTVLLEPDSRVSSLTISNLGDREATFELAGYRWSQDKNEDTLSLDKSFVVTPPVVTLAAGEERVVRVGLLSADDNVATESAYRLRISELSAARDPDGGNLNVRLQILLPVFLTSAERAPDLNFQVSEDREDKLCFVAHNRGATHAKLVWVSTADNAENKVPLQKYILSNSDLRVCSDALSAPGKRYLVGVTSAYQNDIMPYEISITEP